VTERGLTRRDWLRVSGGALAALSLGGTGCGDNWLDVGITDGASYDDVLDHLHRTGPEFGGGLSNHGPMAMDALVALDAGERIASWARRYAFELELMPPGEPIGPDERASAIGAHDRQADWIATYAADIETIAPGELVARDWSALAVGWSASHGILRTAHALRALEREDTPSRRRELAHGLGYWAARNDRVPGVPGARPTDGLDVTSALANVPLVPDSRRKSGGLIIERLAVLEHESAFITAIEAVDVTALPVEQAVHDLVAAAARLYVREGSNDISLLHGVTGTAALSLVLPYLDTDAQHLGLAYAFQTVAALHAIASPAPGLPSRVSAPAATAATLRARAREATDEHVIKLTEACLREYDIEPRSELRAAAALVQG
jgi:hypothetical protein